MTLLAENIDTITNAEDTIIELIDALPAPDDCPLCGEDWGRSHIIDWSHVESSFIKCIKKGVNHGS